jgi:hypothetical protein
MKRRIFGLENEYGLTCMLNGQRRLSPDTIARYLCLPLIRPIGSRRSPQVFVMEATHARDLHYPAMAQLLHSPMLGCVFSQR